MTWHSGICQDEKVISTTWVSVKSWQEQGGGKISLIKFSSYSVKLNAYKPHKKLVGGRVFTHTSVPWGIKVHVGRLTLRRRGPASFTSHKANPAALHKTNRRRLRGSTGTPLQPSLAPGLADRSQSCTTQRVTKSIVEHLTVQILTAAGKHCKSQKTSSSSFALWRADLHTSGAWTCTPCKADSLPSSSWRPQQQRSLPLAMLHPREHPFSLVSHEHHIQVPASTSTQW